MTLLRFPALAMLSLALMVPLAHAQSSRIYPRFVQPSIWHSTTFDVSASRLGIDHFIAVATTVEVGDVNLGVAGFLRTNKHQIASWSSDEQADNAWMTYAFARVEVGRMLLTKMLTCTTELTGGVGLARQTSRFCVDVTTTNAVVLADAALQLRFTPSKALTMSLDLTCFYSPTFTADELVNLPRPTVRFGVRATPWK